MDIPTPFGSEAYAIDDGIVRIGGLFHSAYSDGVVQVRVLLQWITGMYTYE